MFSWMTQGDCQHIDPAAVSRKLSLILYFSFVLRKRGVHIVLICNVVYFIVSHELPSLAIILVILSRSISSDRLLKSFLSTLFPVYLSVNMCVVFVHYYLFVCFVFFFFFVISNVAHDRSYTNALERFLTFPT